MSKLIYSDSLQKFQSLFPEWNVITDPSYKAIVFTKDNYIVTHGHVFKTDSGGETGNANFAPILHADITSKYGAGDTTNYGHVKLTDTVNFPSSYGGTTPVETNGVSSGFAATPMAVRAAYNTAYAHAKACQGVHYADRAGGHHSPAAADRQRDGLYRRCCAKDVYVQHTVCA